MKFYILKLEGMYCRMCENYVNDLLKSNFNIKKAKSNFKKNEAEIFGEEPNKNELNKVLKDYGYKVYKIEEKPEQKKKGLFSFLK